MDIMPSTCLENLKRYWRRRKYQRLINGKRRKIKVLRLGGGSAASGRWKVRRIPKLRLRIISPIRLLARFHDAYIDMMIRLANGLGMGNSGSLFGGKKVAKDRHVAVLSGGVEADSRLVLEPYKRLAASRKLRTDILKQV